MKDLIKVTDTKVNNETVQAVSARDLYLGLRLHKAHWARWYPESIEKNEFFTEGKDWIGFTIVVNGNETKDFAITLRFAQHIAMMARTEKSHDYRNYLLDCEKKLKQQQQWQLTRDTTRIEYKPMTDELTLSILKKGKNPKFYHYTNEADMINRIVLGMSSKKYKAERGIYGNITRNYLTGKQLEAILLLQRVNTGLVTIGMDYEERKDKLSEIFNERYNQVNLIEDRIQLGVL